MRFLQNMLFGLTGIRLHGISGDGLDGFIDLSAIYPGALFDELINIG